MMTLFGVVAATWLLVGLLASYVMGRRGHDAFSWFLLGITFGPLAIPLAFDRLRSERRAPRGARSPTRPRAYGVKVLVGVDASAESRAASERVVHVLGDRLGRLMLATVIDYEHADRRRGADDADHLLADAASAVPGSRPETVVLVGEPGQALMDFAVAEDFDLVVIGSRGAWRTLSPIGSVATRLAGDTRVPVLLVGAPSRDTHARSSSREAARS
jgi:nucleotide-binding universal stress UspA family protein